MGPPEGGDGDDAETVDQIPIQEGLRTSNITDDVGARDGALTLSTHR